MTKEENRRFWINSLIRATACLRSNVRLVMSGTIRENERFWLNAIIWWSQRHREMARRVAECPR